MDHLADNGAGRAGDNAAAEPAAEAHSGAAAVAHQNRVAVNDCLLGLRQRQRAGIGHEQCRESAHRSVKASVFNIVLFAPAFCDGSFIVI
jgi:hypothetical protein